MARRWARGFRKRRAVTRRQRAIVEPLEAEGIEGASVLDIGFGVGDLHFELLRRGAGSVTGVEVSAAMAEQARALAAELGFGERVAYQLGDYAELHEAIGDADVVVLDRSVCCYPDWRALVEPSARHARRYYGLILPRDTWYMGGAARAMNAALFVIRHDFRLYMHPRAEIDAALAEAGLIRVLHAQTLQDEAELYACARAGPRSRDGRVIARYRRAAAPGAARVDGAGGQTRCDRTRSPEGSPSGEPSRPPPPPHPARSSRGLRLAPTRNR